MSQSNLLELSKKGVPNAIASLINRSLNAKNITVKSILKQGCLNLMLESDEVPDQQVLVQFIRKGMMSLGAESIEKVKIYGKQAGEDFPTWTDEFDLFAQTTAIKSPASTTSTISNQKNKPETEFVVPTQRN